MKADEIRCLNDRNLFDSLLEHRDVKRANEVIAKAEEKGPTGLRRRLLSTSVRLSRRMAVDAHKMADECGEQLGLDLPLELYVFSSPQYNAACFKPEAGQLFIIFSSALLESFSGSELRFVVGHELGHYVYRHHDIPIGLILRGSERPDPRLALDLFAWSRYAEISADRAGAHCAQDFDGVSRALFKLASGLSGSTIEFSLEDFLDQVDDMQVEDAEPGQGAPREDWFSTHPFSPLRVKALQLFHDSVLAKSGGISVEQLEMDVQALMGFMEPSYLEGRTEVSESMRRLLFAGGIAVANADGSISDKEIETFEKFLGEGSVSEGLNIDKLIKALDGRTRSVRASASIPQRMQVLRDLCLIAGAEDCISTAERRVLHHIADGLSISRNLVSQALCGDPELD